MKKPTVVMLVVTLLALKTASESLAAEPFSTRSRGPVQQSPGAPTAPATPPYVKPEAPAPQGPVQRVSPTAPLTKQPDPAAQKGEEAKLLSVQSGPVEWISWGYLRAYEPERLGHILAEVNAGRLPRSAVSGVVQPGQLDAFLKFTGPSAGGAAVDKRLPNSAVTKPVPYSPTVVGSALRSLPLQTAPDRIEFGTLMAGQTQYKTVRFIAPMTGRVQVDISNPAFQIRRLRSLNGRFSMRTVQWALPEGTRINAVQQAANASQHRTEPPWAIDARSGEDVEITISLSRDPTVALGDHVGQLRIEVANGPGAIVPLHAHFDGPGNYGVDIIPDDELFMVVPGKSNLLRFKWVNNREPSEATLTLENLPDGFTSPTPVRTVKLGKGEVREDAFIVHVNEALQKPSPEGTGFNLKMVYGPNRNRWIYTVPVRLIPLWLQRQFYARSQFSDGEVVSANTRLQIRSDGWFQFDGTIRAVETDMIRSLYNYDVGISLSGGFAHTVKGSWGRAVLLERGHTTEGKWLESGMNSSLMTNFISNTEPMYSSTGIHQLRMKVTRY